MLNGLRQHRHSQQHDDAILPNNADTKHTESKCQHAKLPGIDRNKSNSIVSANLPSDNELPFEHDTNCRPDRSPSNEAEKGGSKQAESHDKDPDQSNGNNRATNETKRKSVSKERKDKKNRKKNEQLSCSVDQSLSTLKLPDIVLNNKTPNASQSYDESDALRYIANSRNSLNDALRTPVSQRQEALLQSSQSSPTKMPPALLLPMRDRNTRKHRKQNAAERRNSDNDMLRHHERMYETRNIQMQPRSLSVPDHETFTGLCSWHSKDSSEMSLLENETSADEDFFDSETERTVQKVMEENGKMRTKMMGSDFESKTTDINECQHWLTEVDQDYSRLDDLT